MERINTIYITLIFTFTVLLNIHSVLAQSLPEEALVIANNDGTEDRGALFIVDLTTGYRTLISDFGNPAQGHLGSGPQDVELDVTGYALVIDNDAGTNGQGALFTVNLETGNRTIVSDFGNPAQGDATGDDPVGLTIDDMGYALVTILDYGTNSDGALFSVDLETGNRTVISDFNDPAQGDIGDDPTGVSTDEAGNALVIDSGVGMGLQGVLFEVDLATGNRKLISDFGNPAQGPVGCGNTLTYEGSGNSLITCRGTDNLGALNRVDLASGDRSLVSDVGNPAQGVLGFLVGIDLYGTENVMVVVTESFMTSDQGIYRVNLSTGNRILISDFNNPAQGVLVDSPVDLALIPMADPRNVPTLSQWGLIATAGLLGIIGFIVIRRKQLIINSYQSKT